MIIKLGMFDNSAHPYIVRDSEGSEIDSYITTENVDE